MKKQLIVGLLSAGVVVAMLPGVTVAKGKVDTSPCKKGGWTEWVRQDQTAFADQAECVAYVAEGGTLAEPTPTFQSACLGLGGTYVAPWVIEQWGTTFSYPEACTGFDNDTFGSAQLVLDPLCTTVAVEAGWDSSGGFVRCSPYEL